MIRPLDAKPARGKQLFPRKLSRESRPARPAGGGTNAFCFPSLVAPAPPRHRNILHKTQNSAVLHVNFPDSFARYKDYFVPDPRGCCSIVFRKTISARPLSGRTPFSRLRERKNNEIPRDFTRAFAIKDNRFPLHKRPVSTSPFLLTMAFSQNFTVPRNKRRFPPLPQKAGAGRGVFPKGDGVTLGANLFRPLFLSLGKEVPAEQKQINYSK